MKTGMVLLLCALLAACAAAPVTQRDERFFSDRLFAPPRRGKCGCVQADGSAQRDPIPERLPDLGGARQESDGDVSTGRLRRRLARLVEEVGPLGVVGRHFEGLLQEAHRLAW